jgi:CheY-like chemotaxis protein
MGELLLQSELTGKQRHQMETLIHSADQLLNLVDDVLDYSRIEAGRLEIQQLPFDLHSAVEDVAELMAGKAREKKLEVIVRYMPGTPQFLLGDAGRIRQVLMNLVGNAVKFTPAGYVLVSVEMLEDGGESAPPLLRIGVEDTGIGIAPEKLGSIFDMFSQADGSTTRQYGGTGLGLTICRQLVEMMGGAIDVTSTLDQGSCFWFTLRLARAEAQTGRFEPNHAVLVNRRVLVVDDIQANRDLLEESLQQAQMQVKVVASGMEALRELRSAHTQRQPYDMVLVDYLMPEMNGETLVRAIRHDAALAGVPIVVLSSAEERGFVSIFSAMHVSAYLSKPARRHQLLDMMAMVLESHALGRPYEMLTVHSTEALRTRIALEQGTPLAGARILLTEDNRVNREFTTELLRTMGCVVDHAEHGEIAVAKCRQRKYDIILMDCQMPVMDGFEATKAIQSLCSRGEIDDVPIIALTANALEGDRERCMRAGMHDYLSKPVRRANLEAMLLRWLKQVNFPPAPAEESAPPRPAIPFSPITMPFEEEAKAANSNRPGGIDPQALEETRALVGDKINQLTQYFLEDAARYIEEIVQALASAAPASAMVAPAHTLKSSARQFGLNTLAELARTIEESARTQTDDDARRTVQAAMEPLRAALAEAAEYLNLARSA